MSDSSQRFPTTSKCREDGLMNRKNRLERVVKGTALRLLHNSLFRESLGVNVF